ncbi:MAG: divalent-cation tolerance protein CutA [Okeania sp. SIO3B5]|uniref:divalent cation tolerance protein CutA n=1 Tax=Okeania sp. SIO3B5 TaxID=2607811 RepID=UPI0013FE78ED|nr:divalent-cation tolerance protein CutA [Okeania sp. SIO3B5]
MVITTTSSRHDADKITRYLLEKRLAAGIQTFSSMPWNSRSSITMNLFSLLLQQCSQFE